MDSDAATGVRVCGAADAKTAAVLLHDFNVEFDTPTPGPVALLEELYVRPHLRAHGFSDLEPTTGERACYFSRQL